MKCPHIWTVLLSLAAATAYAESIPNSDEIAFFEKKIRPLLSANCYKCHSEKSEKVKGGLLLDSREGARRGGDNGPAVVPGDSEHSLLIEAVRYHNREFAMPPEKAGGKLPETAIADLETWIQMGAPDPREGPAKWVRKYDASESLKWWAFQPVAQPDPPSPSSHPAWPSGDIDRFILAGLEAKGLRPVADADRSTLLRRATFDLTGIPPSPSQLQAFLSDTAPDAFERAVDRLLASPQFGERWGRHWLDVARYAESTGKDTNAAFPSAWRYRDYVIDAWNADKPYDQFLREQIAGDLLPAETPKKRAEQLVATGFLALGPKGLNEQNARQFHLDLADEQIDTLTQSVMGLTVACARCHDHKFDPVPQRDYTALAGIFLSTDTCYGTPSGIQNRHPSPLLELPQNSGALVLDQTLTPETRRRLEQQLAGVKTELEASLRQRFAGGLGKTAATATSPDPRQQLRVLTLTTQLGLLESQLAAFDTSGHSKPLAMGTRDLPASAADLPKAASEGILERLRQRFNGRPPEFSLIADSALYARGEADRPGAKVPRGFPSVFNAEKITVQEGRSGRLELAEALLSRSNPLTSRVIVNRVWLWIFGDGLVSTPDNFGNTGQKPSHPELLDFLATQIREDGWSLKRLVRSIILSHTYRLASTYDPNCFAADPENRLHWRRSPRALEAECVRDAMLAISGQLDLQPPLASAIAEEGEGPIGGPRRGLAEERIVKVGGSHRSVYLPVPRDILPDALAVFDFADPSLVTGHRERTNVPSQSLYLLNSPYVTELSAKMGQRILQDTPPGTGSAFERRLQFAYQLAFARLPSKEEQLAAKTFFARFIPSQNIDSAHSPWAGFCQALIATAEFRYLP
jgi:hypothetical protein